MRPGPCVYRTEWTAVGMPPRGPLMETMVRPVAIRRNVGFDVFNVRLLIGLDKLLRAKRRYQGDLSCSINQLVNSGLMAHYSKQRSGKLGGSSRPTRQATKAAYDKMSVAERQKLFEVLGTLTGLQEGPTGKFSDGTYFEYDRALETSVAHKTAR